MAGERQSSVLINLNEIMQLERERVEAEEETKRSAQAAEVRAKLEAERAREEQTHRAHLRVQEQARAVREAEERLRVERDATLLRVRLEVDAKAQAARERLDREHQQALRRLDREARAGWLARSLGVLLIVGAIGAAAGYATLVAPALREAREREVAALRLADERGRENAALFQRVLQAEAAARSVVEREPDPVTQPGTTIEPESKRGGKLRKSGVRRPPRLHASKQDVGLEGLDVDDDDDPLKGIVDTSKRR